MDGDDRDATVATIANATTEAPDSPTRLHARLRTLPPATYDLADVLGRGGMGEVVAARDLRIGRDVAYKRLRTRSPTDDQLARFLREARIQARLDHPAIVPVYELGTDDDGEPFFTMKRLAGTTLAHQLAQGLPATRALRAIVEVCRAIDFAHARGVIHRDLKPSNVMLGEYGEVYVIDWGIAHAGEGDTVASPGDIVPLPALETGTGDLLGTPGYMSPEQIRGDAPGPALDVYALGAMLFDVLARRPLHPTGAAGITSTLDCPCVAPSARAPDREIPPELDAVCVACLAEDPADRPTARQLADRVEAYLDGDRDLVRRKALAVDLLARARAALASPHGRADAIALAGHALALDQDSLDAAELVTSLLVTPPRELPPALDSDLEAAEQRGHGRRSRIAMWACFVPFLLVPLVVWLDVVSWFWFVSFYAAMVGYAAIAWGAGRRGRISLLVGVPASLAITVIWSRVAGAFMLTPMLICAVLAYYAWSRPVRRRSTGLLAWAIAATMLPLVLEWLGILDPTTTVDGGALTTHSAIFEIHGRMPMVALVLANALFVVTVVWVAGRLARTSSDATRALHVQGWHLRQLVPRVEHRLPPDGSA